LTARAFFNRPSGGLRTPWQWAGFIAVMLTAMFVVSQIALLLVRPVSLLQQQTLGFGALLVAVWFAHVVMLRWVERRPWSFVGLGRSQASRWRIVAGLLVGALAICVPSAGLLLADWLRPVPVAGSVPAAWWEFAGIMLVFFLPQSLAEEMVVRGYLFATARESIGWRGALVLTSVIFGLLHYGNPGAGVQSVLLVTLAGLFLGGVLLVTGSLYAAWMAHFAWNWSMAALLHASVSGLPVAAPAYRVVDNGPDWATGGVWGPEGGAGAALGMFVGMWALIAWRRRHAQRSNDTDTSQTWLNA
jgi:membrane protease YdiL (CAAX protease family)